MCVSMNVNNAVWEGVIFRAHFYYSLGPFLRLHHAKKKKKNEARTISLDGPWILFNSGNVSSNTSNLFLLVRLLFRLSSWLGHLCCPT